MDVILVVLLVSFICGFIAMAVSGNASPGTCFLLGACLGPFGVIAAAIIGSRQKEADKKKGVFSGKRVSTLPKPVVIPAVIQCPHCNQDLNGDDLQAGRRYTCPFCNSIINAET